MSTLVIATPGVPASTPGSGGTLKGLQHAFEMGLRGMEMEWVQRVPENTAHAEEIRAISEQLGMTLTVHAPFFINLNSADQKKIEASIKRILSSLTMAQIAGAVSVCVHAAFNHGADSKTVTDKVRSATDRIMKQKDKLFPDVNLGYETMGKGSQWGTLEEVLQISKEFDIYPTIDPAHMHARANGGVNTAEEWHDMLDTYEDYLGKDALKHMHLHFSGIAYGLKGEKHHLAFQESDARWEDFLQVLKDRKVGGVLVSESPRLEHDALLLKETYESLK